MPNQNLASTDLFAALADPTRRAVIAALSRGTATVSDLARPFGMALPSFTQHLGVLERAGLILSRKEGRVRVCSLNVDALREAEGWISTQRQAWEARMDRFEAHLDQTKKETRDEQP